MLFRPFHTSAVTRTPLSGFPKLGGMHISRARHTTSFAATALIVAATLTGCGDSSEQALPEPTVTGSAQNSDSSEPTSETPESSTEETTESKADKKKDKKKDEYTDVDPHGSSTTLLGWSLEYSGVGSAGTLTTPLFSAKPSLSIRSHR